MSSIGRKRALRHERLSDDPVPLLKRRGTERDPYVEYWVAHNYQLFKEPTNPMEYLFSRPKSLRRAKSSTGFYTQSESGSNKSKNGYNDENFEIYLQSKGSFMGKHKDGISNDSKELCRRLLEVEHIVPRDTVFDQAAFESACERVRKQSEMGVVIRIIGELIVPSAECAIDLGHVTFEHLISKVNEVWDPT
ncbi:hypothetical protein MGYG_07019 [Nannizzia gypsea CBS 118893]|uniref:DUF7924 domain-containing protein n=1 Tax=Arthroderma gypseum (strain ATCC MYA-4604 / CBS 118893) TaxID=535722 RepID=E4V1U9_ARTGP|nr:hypothetical protein MGYG_07019 [Nannizzia gypsea CBS 118893]EFR04014.1 hypothetical protein MGYG_07019 [Nannizzia gypsea CBS 118893]